MSEEMDFLDEVIEESTAANPHFPQLMELARRNGELLSTLATQRKRNKVSQTKVAAAMAPPSRGVALEKTAADKISTIEKYAGALGSPCSITSCRSARSPPWLCYDAYARLGGATAA